MNIMLNSVAHDQFSLQIVHTAMFISYIYMNLIPVRFYVSPIAYLNVIPQIRQSDFA